MINREVIIYDKASYKKRLAELSKLVNEINKNDLNGYNAFNVIYEIELLRNALYKCIKVPRAKLPEYPLPEAETGICKFEDNYSDGILKLKIYELMPPVKTPYNNGRLEKTCQFIAEKYKGLFLNKKVIIKVQVGIPRDNWDIDNRDLRYVFNGFVYGGLISDDNINFVSYMLEGIKSKENFIKILISEKKNIKKVCSKKF